MNAPTQTNSSTAQRLPALPAILRALRGLTNMRFAALIRLTENEWQACAVDDGAGLGLRTGDVWEAKNTLCHKVREINSPLDLPCLTPDALQPASGHMTNILGIRAYFAFPIYRSDGSFFGTLCAMDTVARQPVSAAVIDAASAFSQCLGEQLDTVDMLNQGFFGNTAASTGNDFRTATQTFQPTTQKLPLAAQSDAKPGAALAVPPATDTISRPVDPGVQAKVLSVLGHDLRNPMHSLMAAIEMIQIKPMEPRLERLMGMVHGSAVRLSELARQSLDFARLQMLGDVVTSIVPAHDVVAGVGAAVARVRAGYPQRNIIVTADECPHVDVDPARIDQLLEIILTHAVKHCGVDREVSLHAYRAQAGLICDICVPDYILDVALVPYVFDPFYAVDGEAQTAQLGIGLYLARAIALAHGGTLTLELRDASEAHFMLKIPASASLVSGV